METKNLGLVKALFRQSTSPVRTDVWWYDTVNSVLKYYNVATASWVATTVATSYTKISVTANSYSDITIGLLSAIRGILVEYAGERGSLHVEGLGRCLITGTTPYVVTTDEQGGAVGVTYQVRESGANLVLRVTVDNSSGDAFKLSYRIEVKPKY